MSRSGREALPDVWVWSGGHLGCLGVVGWPSWISGSVRRPSQMSRSCREALTDVREWVGGPPVCPGVFVRSSRMSESGWEALLDVRQL